MQDEAGNANTDCANNKTTGVFGGFFGGSAGTGGSSTGNARLNPEPIPALTFEIPPDYTQVRRQEMVEEHRRERRRGRERAAKAVKDEIQDKEKV